jgi:uncharacterized membrane protein YozB (DUF420 family)/cytochrome oxidase Cu insertion factor (SCO1/SenC/PrrC family)
MRHEQLKSATLRSAGRRLGMSTAMLILGTVLWMAAIAMLGFVLWRRQQPLPPSPDAVADQQSSEEQAEPVQATTKTVRIGFPTRELPAFEFPECMGGTVSRDSLKGKRWLASFFFTRCNGPCPLLIRDISELHRRVAKTNPDFMFVTFTVDSSFDSADVLKKYSDTFLADHDRWKFLTGDELQIHDLIRRGFSQYVQPNLGEMRKPGFEVAHSNRSVLVNEDGVPVATYLMTVPEDVVRLRRVIEGKTEFPQPGPALTVEPTGENPQVPLNLLPVPTKPEGETDEAPDAATSAAPDDQSVNENSAPAADSAAGSTETPPATQNPEKTGSIDQPAVGTDATPADPQASSEGLALPRSAGVLRMGAAADSLDSLQQRRRGEWIPVVLPADESSGASGESTAPDQTSMAEQATGGTGISAAEKNRSIDEALPQWVSVLPSINATLNGLCTLLLIAGYLAIRRSQRVQHRNLMISAFAVSVVFLACYVTYHEALYKFTGERGRAFVGSDLARILYLGILIPHVILAAAVPVLALRVFWLAWRQQWVRHRRLARITLPIWLFVSITGVLIYGMLYHWPWRTMEPTPVIPGSTI